MHSIFLFRSKLSNFEISIICLLTTLVFINCIRVFRGKKAISILVHLFSSFFYNFYKDFKLFIPFLNKTNPNLLFFMKFLCQLIQFYLQLNIFMNQYLQNFFLLFFLLKIIAIIFYPNQKIT